MIPCNRIEMIRCHRTRLAIITQIRMHQRIFYPTLDGFIGKIDRQTHVHVSDQELPIVRITVMNQRLTALTKIRRPTTTSPHIAHTKNQ